MTDQTQDTANGATATAKKREITPRGHKLPQVTFAEARPLVNAMIELNGPSSRNLIFGQAGAAATGGTAARRWAALGYYGFREDAGDGKYQVSERGRAFISGDEAAEQRAKQHALMATGARALIERFSTRQANEDTLAGILREDFSVPEGKAMDTARLLVSLATDAGFIVDGVFQARPIEAALEAVPVPEGGSANGKPQQTPRPAAPKAPARQRTPAAQQSATPQQRATPPAPQTPQSGATGSPLAPVQTEGQSGPFGVSVEIRIDAEKHSPEEIGKIVREVRQALTTAD